MTLEIIIYHSHTAYRVFTDYFFSNKFRLVGGDASPSLNSPLPTLTLTQTFTEKKNAILPLRGKLDTS